MINVNRTPSGVASNDTFTDPSGSVTFITASSSYAFTLKCVPGTCTSDFKKFLVEDLVFGQSPKWSASHKFMGKKDLGKYNNIGDSYKVYLMMGNLMYHCEYVLVRTNSAYLWIDYTSIQEIFDKNFAKFEEFMSGFKVTNF